MIRHFELMVYPSIKGVCYAAVDIFIELLTGYRYKTFIVPGGKTPRMFYYYLAQHVRNWRDTSLVLSDERLVREESSESNFGMIKRNLLNLIQEEIPPRLVPIVNGFSPEQSIEILKSINSSVQQLFPPKAAFLGIGSDGHTASLFPDDEEKFYCDEPFLIVDRLKESFQRISVSAQVLAETSLLVFLVTGKDKKAVLRQIVNVSDDVRSLPIKQVIKNAQNRVIILCDRDAAPE